MNRRAFFSTAFGRLAGATIVAGAAGPLMARTVTLIEFSDSGQRKGVVKLDKVQKTDAEWKKQLTPEEFEVARHAGTERPSPASIGIITSMAFIVVSAAGTPSFLPTPSLNPVPAGRVFGSRLPSRTFKTLPIAAWAWRALKCAVPSATPISVTSSMTVQNPLACAIA